MIGYIGTGLLLLAYLALVTKWNKWFLSIDALASLLLTIHAFLIHDFAFIIVNAFVTIMLVIKICQKKPL